MNNIISFQAKCLLEWEIICIPWSNSIYLTKKKIGSLLVLLSFYDIFSKDLKDGLWKKKKTTTRNVSKGQGCPRLKNLKRKLLMLDADGWTGVTLYALSTILQTIGWSVCVCVCVCGGGGGAGGLGAGGGHKKSKTTYMNVKLTLFMTTSTEDSNHPEHPLSPISLCWALFG